MTLGFARLRRLRLVALFCAAAFAASPAGAAESPAPTVRGISDLSPPLQAALQSSFNRFLHGSPAPGRSANDLAWDCLAVTSLMRAGAPDGTARLRTIVDALLAKALHRDGGALTWGPDSSPALEAQCGKGGYKAFGHCNPGGTAYTFQSGMAIACLSEAGDLLHDPSLVEQARTALHYWDTYSVQVPDCNHCIYYWYDDDRSDAGRYVRNVNVIMGYGAASLAARHGDAAARSLAEATLNADIWEGQHGNHGYLGRLDHQWVANRSEATRIEYHAPFVALFAARIGAALGLSNPAQHGRAVWRNWATCDTPACRADDCRGIGANPSLCLASATFVHCAFRRSDPTAASMCEAVLTHAGSSSLGGPAIFSILSANQIAP